MTKATVRQIANTLEECARLLADYDVKQCEEGRAYRRVIRALEKIRVEDPVKVWTVLELDQRDDSTVAGIYANEKMAKKASDRFNLDAIKQGRAVYWNPKTQEDNPDWTVDYEVSGPHEVEGT